MSVRSKIFGSWAAVANCWKPSLYSKVSGFIAFPGGKGVLCSPAANFAASPNVLSCRCPRSGLPGDETEVRWCVTAYSMLNERCFLSRHHFAGNVNEWSYKRILSHWFLKSSNKKCRNMGRAGVMTLIRVRGFLVCTRAHVLRIKSRHRGEVG
jgi:hypothetical protein